MSAADEEPEEPDLTALLDLVLQLVMFFLAVARIDNEQKDQSVVLPQASIARSLNKDYNKLVIINLIPAKDPNKPDSEAADLQPNEPVRFVRYSVFEGYFTRDYTNLGGVKDALAAKLKVDEKGTPPADWALGKGRSLVVLRAHRNCNYKQVHDVMITAKEVGFTDAQLRAYLPDTKAP